MCRGASQLVILYLQSQCWAFYFPSRPVKCKHWEIMKKSRTSSEAPVQPSGHTVGPEGPSAVVQLMAQLTSARALGAALCGSLSHPARPGVFCVWGLLCPTGTPISAGGSVLRGWAVRSWHVVCEKQTKTPSVPKCSV